MPRTRDVKTVEKVRVSYETCKAAGAQVRCLSCGYTGAADVIRMRSRRNGSRSMERCAACRSLNIICEEISLMEEKSWSMDVWEGCYPSQWKGVIVADAMAHPAKFSSRLIRRIYEHLFEQGWVARGDRVLDPFGGVALGALHAMEMGLEWAGVELEPKFVKLGEENIGSWNIRFSKMPHWGSARLVQGDSRRLLEVIGNGAKGTVSSPPFMGSQQVDNRENPSTAMSNFWQNRMGITTDGESEGQLANMKTSDDGFQAALTSPPFEQRSADGGWQMLDKYAKEGKLTVKQVKGDPKKSFPSWSEDRDTSYGDSDGQMANMKTSDDGFQAALSSPPYEGSDLNHQRNGLMEGENLYQRPYMDGRPDKDYGATEGNLGSMPADGFQASLSSPPYKNDVQGGGLNVNKPATFRGVLKDGSLSMGDSEGNLGTMDDGGFDAAISSPPFRHSEGGTPEPKPGGVIDDRLYARHAAGNSAAEGYGVEGGQLANMKEGDFQGAVSSPPYVSGGHHPDQTGAYNKNGGGHNQDASTAGYGEFEGQMGKMNATDEGFQGAVSSPPYESGCSHTGGKDDSSKMRGGSLTVYGVQEHYGDSEGQLGADSGDDFWMAARQIVEQVFLALEPGGHACWVVKDFVRNKERVPFSDQWRQLCEAVGFVTVHEHRASLVHRKGASLTLEGETVEHKTESKSFFRRIAERKGSPRVDWEVVWCMEKPA